MTKRILVVDDEQDLRNLVCTALTRDGYQVLPANNAQEGLQILSNDSQIDLALLDITMPGMDGLEMLAKVRDMNKNLPVIMMTAIQTPATVIAAMREQACDYLAKPFALDDLLTAVATALKLRRRELGIEVLSARPEWIELRVPCDLAAIDPLERLMMQLNIELPAETRENVTYAFREMLRNAIEHGGKNDPTQSVEVGYLHTPRLILYRIKDPGEGFRLESLYRDEGAIAAFLNPPDDPTSHEQARAQAGLRPGGFGILIARELVDEMIYNERHNEVLLIKYLNKGKT